MERTQHSIEAGPLQRAWQRPPSSHTPPTWARGPEDRQFHVMEQPFRATGGVVVQELRDAFDDWDLALWFAESNAWLCGAAPVDVIGGDPVAVLHAARADRLIARGQTGRDPMQRNAP